MDFTKSSVLFVWPVKLFLTEFINDWSRERPLDLYKYVPVTYDINIRCTHTELLIPGNTFLYILLFVKIIFPQYAVF